jgi:hypothetical protein
MRRKGLGLPPDEVRVEVGIEVPEVSVDADSVVLLLPLVVFPPDTVLPVVAVPEVRVFPVLVVVVVVVVEEPVVPEERLDPLELDVRVPVV